MKTVYHLAPALTLVSVGYGLAVPCLSTLFSNVPMEQGIMQVRLGLSLSLSLRVRVRVRVRSDGETWMMPCSMLHG